MASFDKLVTVPQFCSIFDHYQREKVGGNNFIIFSCELVMWQPSFSGFYSNNPHKLSHSLENGVAPPALVPLGTQHRVSFSGENDGYFQQELTKVLGALKTFTLLVGNGFTRVIHNAEPKNGSLPSVSEKKFCLGGGLLRSWQR